VEEAELRAVGVVEGKGKVVQVRENLKMLKNNASGVNHNCKIMHDIKKWLERRTLVSVISRIF